MKFIKKKHLCQRLFKYCRMAEGVQQYQKETLTKVLSCKYCEFFKTPISFEYYLRIAASESKAEFVQSKEIIQRVAKIYQQTFSKIVIETVVSVSATFSNIAQTRLLLRNFAEELHL